MAGSTKELKKRIKSVKSTQKITKAMQMMAAAKLRKARVHVEASEPYAGRMRTLIYNLAHSTSIDRDNIPLLDGNGASKRHLIVVVSSNRGLCGGFNSSLVKAARKLIGDLKDQGKEAKLFCIGKKGYEQLKSRFPNLIVGHITDFGAKQVDVTDAHGIANRVLYSFANDEFDVCMIIYNKFKSVISQVVTLEQIIPVQIDNISEHQNNTVGNYECEPLSDSVIRELLPRNIMIQIYHALLESAASEQAARMTAMDNATNNANDMIKSLTLQYNRTRQSMITSELIEIISGAEAL